LILESALKYYWFRGSKLKDGLKNIWVFHPESMGIYESNDAFTSEFKNAGSFLLRSYLEL